MENIKIPLNGCFYCKHNKSGLKSGYWCIYNCINGSKFEMAKQLSQSELEARASIAGDLLREGEVTRVECFRVEMDAALGENTGDLRFETNNCFQDNSM